MRFNTYNPDCDYCDNCGQHGHEPEDCCNPSLPDSPYLAQNRSDTAPTKSRRWAVWLCVALLAFLVLVALAAYAWPIAKHSICNHIEKDAAIIVANLSALIEG